MYRAQGTEASPTVMVGNTEVSRVAFVPYNGSGYFGGSGIIGQTDNVVLNGSSMPTHLRFFTTPANSVTATEIMRITSNGLAGIGTTTPISKLNIVGSAVDDTDFIIVDRYGGATSGAGAGVLTRTARGTSASPTAILSDNLIGIFGMRGYDGSAFTSGSRAYFGGYASQNWNSTAQGTYLQW